GLRTRLAAHEVDVDATAPGGCRPRRADRKPQDVLTRDELARLRANAIEDLLARRDVVALEQLQAHRRPQAEPAAVTNHQQRSIPADARLADGPELPQGEESVPSEAQLSVDALGV